MLRLSSQAKKINISRANANVAQAGTSNIIFSLVFVSCYYCGLRCQDLHITKCSSNTIHLPRPRRPPPTRDNATTREVLRLQRSREQKSSPHTLPQASTRSRYALHSLPFLCFFDFFTLLTERYWSVATLVFTLHTRWCVVLGKMRR